MRILMVCLGNICRSPLAEGVMKHKVKEHGLNWQVDSAGTGNWHAGDLPDKRSIALGRKYGIDITDQRARQVKSSDFSEFDVIYAMDKSNLRNLQNLATTDHDRLKVRLMMSETNEHLQEVPDPYYDDNGFDQVYQMLNRACDAAINRLKNE